MTGTEEKANPRYPDVTVKLLDEDGNAFYILGKVKEALRREGVSAQEIELYIFEATQGDYNHLLQVTMGWVNIS